MTDEEINSIEEGRLNDKLKDLDVESVVSSNDIAASIEIGGVQAEDEPMMEKEERSQDLVDDDEVKLSITDEDAPLRAQDKMNRVAPTELLDNTAGPKKSNKKHRINKHGHKLPVTANNNIDHRPRAPSTNRYGGKVRKHRYGKQDQDSMANPFGAKSNRTLKATTASIKPPKPIIMEGLPTLEEIKEKNEFDMNIYLDNKLSENAKMTSELKSTLKSFDGLKETKENKE